MLNVTSKSENEGDWAGHDGVKTCLVELRAEQEFFLFKI